MSAFNRIIKAIELARGTNDFIQSARTSTRSALKLKKSIKLSGNYCNRQFYTYYDDPLVGLKVKQSLWLTASTKSCKFETKSGEIYCISTEDGDVPFFYKGKPVGCIFNHHEFLELAKHYDVKVEGKIVGTYHSPNGFSVPSLKLYFDNDLVHYWYKLYKLTGLNYNIENSKEFFLDQLEFETATKGYKKGKVDPQYGATEKQISFFLQRSKTADNALRNLNEKSVASLSLLEPQEGSSAKPHIGIYVDDVLISEVNARSTSYQRLLEFGIGETYGIGSIKFTNDKRSYIWKVVLFELKE